jgi:Mlc titration factor MtfA (ptsG expression regulator)
MTSRLRRWWNAPHDEALPREWRELAERRLAAWPRLTPEQRGRLEGLTMRLVTQKRWEASRGFTLSDEIRVTIAAHAALLILEIGYEAYRNVTSIIIHPTTILLTGAQPGPIPGSWSDDPVALLGLAHYEGPVVIAWDAALHQARHPEHGHNVVFHEFAHRLDMLDGLIDGTPLLPDARTRQGWIEVCTAEYRALRSGGTDELLSDYAAVDPGEFFAVVTEVFFSRPVELQALKPALYQVLSDFYRQDLAGAAARP